MIKGARPSFEIAGARLLSDQLGRQIAEDAHQ